MKRAISWLIPVVFAVGCGQGDVPSPSDPPTIAIDTARYVLAEEPANARHVIPVRKEVKDGEEVVLVGRVGGSKNPVSDERAVFSVVDLSLKACDGDPNCYDFL